MKCFYKKLAENNGIGVGLSITCIGHLVKGYHRKQFEL